MDRIGAEGGVDRRLRLNADRHRQGARVELQRQEAGLLQRQAGNDAVVGEHGLHRRGRDLLAVQEDAQRLLDQALGDLAEQLRAVAVELERDVRQTGPAGKGHLLTAGDQVRACERDRLAVQLAGRRDPLARGVLLHEFELGGLADEPLGLFRVLQARQLNDDAIGAEHLDFGLGNAVRVDAALDHIQDALHGGALLVGRNVGKVRLQCQLSAALQVEAEFGALADERAQVDARVARQRVSARNVVTRPLWPDDEDSKRRQDDDEDQTFHGPQRVGLSSGS